MIMTLEDVKVALGIAPNDSTSDVQLMRLIASATKTIEGMTLQRFSAPIMRTEYRPGPTESDVLILAGHIDDSAEADNPSEALDPSFSLTIASRPLPRSTTDWTDLVEGTDWERREDSIFALGGWGVWDCTVEYRLTYLDGYVVVPADIQSVLLELVMNQRAVEARVNSGTAGITSESLGEYRYSVNYNAVGAGGMTTLSTLSRQTLMSYKRLLVG